MLVHTTKHKLHKDDLPPTVKKTIRCTPENAAQMQQVVKNWPELHRLVKHLQDQNHFPGLRAMQITLTGTQEYVDQGLAALLPENAPTAPKNQSDS